MAYKFHGGDSPRNLPQKDETWYVSIRRVRVWIAPPDGDPYNPTGVLLFNLSRNMIQGLEVTQGDPSPQEILNILLKVMLNPPQEIENKGYRPGALYFEDEEITQALFDRLKQLGIEAIHQPDPGIANEVFAELEENIRDGEDPPGLLSVEGVTPALMQNLFSAAADFYREQLWLELSDEATFAITVPPDDEPKFLKVLGNAGIEYGIAMYRRWEDVLRMYQVADSPLEILPEDGSHSLLFSDRMMIPFDDLDAIDEYDLEVANELAYPMPVVFTRQGDVRRPSYDDLQWLEAAMRALSIFVRLHLKPISMDEFEPVEAGIRLNTYGGEKEVHIKYPGGVVPLETRPVDMADFPAYEEDKPDDVGFFNSDPRAAEGLMRMYGGGFGDPKLDEAQDLMYQAWETTNPAKRINLAHRALSISQNCADAYVLLAEDLADTKGRALEFYQKGVEAGKKALGPDYFENNEGYFWGLLETRPYMRAREGLARTLWELGRKEEAIQHYRELLRLNPNDNQGIRYILLNLLLHFDRDKEVLDLLDEYEGDNMAEFIYTKALVKFRLEGASDEANNALREALEVNQNVAPYLIGHKRIPSQSPDFITLGGESEAANYAASHLRHWRRTEGAIRWLKSHLPDGKTNSKNRKKRGSNFEKRR